LSVTVSDSEPASDGPQHLTVVDPYRQALLNFKWVTGEVSRCSCTCPDPAPRPSDCKICKSNEVWAKPATTPLACASAQSQGTLAGRCQKGAALAVFIPLPKCGVPPHTEHNMRKMRRCDMSRFEPTSRVLKNSCLSIRPNYFLIREQCTSSYLDCVKY
jgi:hypothetical protein